MLLPFLTTTAFATMTIGPHHAKRLAPPRGPFEKSRTGGYWRNRSPAIPPSTASHVPVTDPAVGLAK